MNLICSNEKFNDELLLVVKLFFSPTEVEESDLNIKVDYNILDNNLSYDISISCIFNKSLHNDKILTKQHLEKEDKYV